jgi:glycerophosphoryl diester phosphodiesterase
MKKIIVICILSMVLLHCRSNRPAANTINQTTFDKEGHRGCRGLMPENTIPAMLKAIDLGVTTLEMDAVISADKKVVVSHDVYFNENITTTPEGKFLTKAEAARRLLYTMPYDSIRKYDVGMKPHPDFPRQQKIAVYKPLLSDLIDATEAYAAKNGRTIHYNIEIKSNPANDGVKHPAVEEFTDLLMQVIRGKGISDRTIVQSFDPRGLQIIQKKYPGTSTSLLIEASDHRSLDEQLQQLGFTPAVYSPNSALVTPELVRQCHEKKIKVIPWTVNTIEGMKKLAQMGVDGMITDYPDLYQQL